MDQKEVDLDYLREAYKLAELSPDPSTQNGALIVRRNDLFSVDFSNVIGTGFNDFPEGIMPTSARIERPEKYSWIEHAEREAIYSAARLGNSTNGGIMYVPWYACAECGRAIVEAGIKEVIGYSGPERWWKETRKSNNGERNWYDSIEKAMQMFKEAGVKHRIVDGNIGGVRVRFDGVLREP